MDNVVDDEFGIDRAENLNAEFVHLCVMTYVETVVMLSHKT